MTMAFYLNIYYKYKADFQHSKQLMTCIYASFVHLINMIFFILSIPPFFAL